MQTAAALWHRPHMRLARPWQPAVDGRWRGRFHAAAQLCGLLAGVGVSLGAGTVLLVAGPALRVP